MGEKNEILIISIWLYSFVSLPPTSWEDSTTVLLSDKEFSSSLVAGGSGGLGRGISCNILFSETHMGEQIIFICMKVNLWVPKSRFPYSSHRESVAGASIELKSESVSRASFPCLHSLIQHQTSLICVSRCSLSVHWATWLWRKHRQMQGSQESKLQATRQPRAKSEEWRATREWTPLSRRVCIPKFSHACNGHTHYGQWFLFWGVTDRQVPSCVTPILPGMCLSSLC